MAAAAGQFSPNGDGLADTVLVATRVASRGASGWWSPGRAAARRPNVHAAVAAAGPASLTWDGRGDGGTLVPDGAYTLTLTPLDRARNAGARVSVGVTSFGAFVGSHRCRPVLPAGPRCAGERTAVGSPCAHPPMSSCGSWTPPDRTVRTISGPRPAGPVSIAWDGRSDAGAFVPQGQYRIRVQATVGDRSEVHLATVRAAAFELRPSKALARRGARLSLTVVTSEPLKANPRLTVRQPGRTAYVLTLNRVSSRVYRVSWTVRTGGRVGTMRLTVVGVDKAGGRNSTSSTMGLR